MIKPSLADRDAVAFLSPLLYNGPSASKEPTMKKSFRTTCAVIAIAAAIFYLPVSRAESGGPKYEVDVTWPKPLPDRWVIGGLGGVCVDAQDHVFLLNRQDVLGGDLNAGHLAPADDRDRSRGQSGQFLGRHRSCSTRASTVVTFDKDNNMWIGSSPSGMIQKYSHDGSKLLLQIGKKGVFDSSDGTVKGPAAQFKRGACSLCPPASLSIRKTATFTLSDGEGAGGNRRIAVMDRERKISAPVAAGRHADRALPERRERRPGLRLQPRQDARLQVYDKMGNFKKNIEMPWTPYTPPADGKAEGERRRGGVARSLARCQSEASCI